MHMTSVEKQIIRIVLVLVIAASWYYAFRTYTENKEELFIYIADTARILALPYRIARLYTEETTANLPVPIADVRVAEIADTWGAARANGRMHEGVDIFAERNTPIFSATRGYVVRTGVNELGGNYVFIIGPGGVRYYYAHLERVAQGIEFGTEVTSDTVIGFVGNTGNASTTAPHLHFGVYERGPQNPYPLLIDRVTE